ncbi:MAG: hypothetical protein HN657_00125 [Candidatus Marinimicrobia bacterium]|jgi:hypothetical protein|nr:hypothetical protein [Candidatus Neomarinimicrobiota bacterium]MBT3732553.1 hypothetical protein [Candidatus Neomarinimicrobiota bacterium]MBT4145121.1 hypothetical protein [Candidatus Neomarinimicrobiota bacterium]MBT4991770.1 hypothetical protein [Candidatus Neomarinimicrobiota bacterium]MBT5405705.1 hypothetical protein [Candidatus Neomarinimicrobiota bacterium]
MKQNKNLIYGLIVIAGMLLAYVTTQNEVKPVQEDQHEHVTQKPQVTNRGKMPISLQPGFTQIGRIQVKVPKTWQKETPSSNMRVAQFRLPKVSGDAEDASIAVFSGIGGGVDGNIDRWLGQFKRADGKPMADFASISTETKGTIKITYVSAEGIFLASSMGGAGEEKRNFKLMAAIVETETEPYFFKGTGPVKTIDAFEKEFVRFIESIVAL